MSRTLLDDLTEAESKIKSVASDPCATEFDMISAMAQLTTIHEVIATMAPLGAETGSSVADAARAAAHAEALAKVEGERNAALEQVQLLARERAELLDQVRDRSRPGSPMADREPEQPTVKSPMEMATTTFLAVLRYDLRRRRALDDQQGRMYDNQALVHAEDLQGLAAVLDRDADGDLVLDGVKVLHWPNAIRGSASFAYKASS